MARPRIQLKPETLRHYRAVHGATQKEVAESMRRDPDQDARNLVRVYQRIEKDGVTSPRTAAKLAQHWGVTVEDLQRGPEKDQDVGGAFWFERVGSEHGEFLLGGARVLGRIREELGELDRLLAYSELNGGGEVARGLERSASCSRITLDNAVRLALAVTNMRHGLKLEVSFKEGLSREDLDRYHLFGAKPRAHGIHWAKPGNWQLDYITHGLTDMALDLVDELEVGGQAMPRADSSVVVRVLLRLVGAHQVAVRTIGEMIFDNVHEAFWSIFYYIKTTRRTPSWVDGTSPITIAFTGMEPFNWVQVDKRWEDSSGALLKAPWRTSWASNFAQLVRTADQIPPELIPDPARISRLWDA